MACVALLATLTAAGCGGGTPTPSIIFITLPPGPGSVGPAPTIGSSVISTSAPDDRWTATFKKPVVTGISATVAGKMNDAITAAVNGYIDAFTGSGLPAVTGSVSPSTLEGDFSIALASPTIVSLRFTVFTRVGGGALVGKPGSINLAVPSGSKINLTDILSDPTAALPTLSSKARSVLATSLGRQLTWPGSATSISFFDKAWAMTDTGLEFTWAPGVVAGKSAGMPSANLAWSGIKSLIKSSGPAGEFVR
jgi:hypothetical protein